MNTEITLNLPVQNVIDRVGTQVIETENGFFVVLTRLRDILQFLIQPLRSYQEQVSLQIGEIIDAFISLDSEQLANLRTGIEAIRGSGLGTLNEIGLRYLRDIHQELSAALHQSPDSYNRRLAMQDAHIRIRQFEAVLEGSTLPVARVWLFSIRKWESLFEFRTEPTNPQRTGALYIDPYVTGDPLQKNRVALFKGRKELADQIVLKLRLGRSTFLVYGARRMGKSSFLAHLSNLLPSMYVPVYFDAQGASQNEASFFFSLAESIHFTLKREIHLSSQITPPAFANFRSNDMAYVAFEQWLRENLELVLNERTRLLITIDEFEKIGEAMREGRMSETVLDHLRNIIQHWTQITLLFTGVQDLTALSPEIASYFVSVVAFELSYLDDVSAKDLICNPNGNSSDQVTPPYTDAAVAHVIHLTHCQPFLIQAICSESIAIANEEQLTVVDVRHIDRAIEQVQEKFNFYFVDLWKSAKEEGRRFLIELAQDNIVTQIPTNIDDLIRRRIVKGSAQGTYEIEIPLLKAWIVRQA